jgi:hypothetical protein
MAMRKGKGKSQGHPLEKATKHYTHNLVLPQQMVRFKIIESLPPLSSAEQRTPRARSAVMSDQETMIQRAEPTFVRDEMILGFSECLVSHCYLTLRDHAEFK